MQRFFEEATALVMPMALKARRPVSMKTPQPRSSVMPMALEALRAVSKIHMTLKRNNPVHIQSDSISCCAVEAPGYNTTTACTMAIDGTSPGKKTRREPRALGYLTHTTRAHQKKYVVHKNLIPKDAASSTQTASRESLRLMSSTDAESSTNTAFKKTGYHTKELQKTRRGTLQ